MKRMQIVFISIVVLVLGLSACNDDSSSKIGASDLIWDAGNWDQSNWR